MYLTTLIWDHPCWYFFLKILVNVYVILFLSKGKHFTDALYATSQCRSPVSRNIQSRHKTAGTGKMATKKRPHCRHRSMAEVHDYPRTKQQTNDTLPGKYSKEVIR
jgi:hypothetical protein